MCKKKLLFIVGAGASIDFGMPSINKIDKLCDTWCNKIANISLQNISLYGYLKNKINEHYNSIENPQKDSTNYEEVLYTALNIYSLNNSNKSNPVSAFYDFKSFPQISINGQTKEVDYNDFAFMASHLIDNLLVEFRKRCNDLSTNKEEELVTLKSFLDTLKKEYEISTLTLNHDDIFYRELSDSVTGFNSEGIFDPKIIHDNYKWNFMYHLHGSVHFDMISTDNNLHEITFKNDLTSDFQHNSMGRSMGTTIEDQYILTTNIIEGYGKSFQIQKNPFFTYLIDFSKKIHEADILIFAGYGFNDTYLNNIIGNSFNYQRKRPVIILTLTNDKIGPMQFRTDAWSRNLAETIVTNQYKMSTWEHTSAPDIEKLKRNNEFEISIEPNRPLSIWHNGFIKACQNPGSIIDEINRWYAKMNDNI